MKIFFTCPRFLTDPTEQIGILLTLLFFAIYPLHALSDTGLYASDPRYQNAVDASAQNEQKTAMRDYLRAQLLSNVTVLPDLLRNPARLALGDMRSARNLLDFGMPSDDDGGVLPGARLLSPTTDGSSNEMTWLSSTYHHRHGFLPTRDALMLGPHAKQGIFGSYMQMDLHPYVGQNWFSTRNYWGTDLAINLASPSDTANAARPWGKLVVGYTNGESNLTDNGRGLDLHGEINLTDHWSFNSGVRQSDPSGGSNYALVQWKTSVE